MPIFCYKPIDKPIPLSEQLRTERESQQLNCADLSLTTRIPLKYLEALEAGNYSELPKAKAYRQAYVREYALALGLNTAATVRQFGREDGLEGAETIHPHTALKHFPFASLALFARNALLILTVVSFGGYLMWQVQGVLRPPKLIVYAPLEGDVATQASVLVQGETEPETRLTINGQETMVNERGIFETKVDGSDGVNTIMITATKKHGKTSTVTRHLVIRTKNFLPGKVSMGEAPLKP